MLRSVEFRSRFLVASAGGDWNGGANGANGAQPADAKCNISRIKNAQMHLSVGAPHFLVYRTSGSD